jgi:hypothetical protein
MLDVSTIEVGNWIWTSGMSRWDSRDKKERIREVVRLTKTLIICDEGDTYDRFNRLGGFSGVGNASYSHARIVCLATPEEIETVGIPVKKSRIAEKERRKKNDEMKACLPTGMEAWVNEKGVWNAKFERKELSEEMVLRIARFLATLEEAPCTK